MPSSVKNKLVSKMNIDQLDDVDSMIDDFLPDDDYDDDDEYFTAVSNETCINCGSSEYSELTATATTNTSYNTEYYDNSVFEDTPNENDRNNIYSNIFFYLSFFDFTKYFN
jgi:hypothetical protein